MRHVHVYQPAVKLRAVMVMLDEQDQAHTEDLEVLGCVVRVFDEFVWTGWESDTPPEPKLPTAESLREAGYLFRASREEHDVLVWDDQYRCPLRVGDDLSCSDQIVVGPAERPAAWWDSQLADRAADLQADARRRRQAATHAKG